MRRIPVALSEWGFWDEDFVDPPLDRTVTDEYNASKTREIDKSDRIAHPESFASWFPERPYFSSENYVRQLEAYDDAVDEAQKSLKDYDAFLIVGGSGPIVDLPFITSRSTAGSRMCGERLVDVLESSLTRWGW